MKRCNAGCFTPIMGDWDTCGDCKNKITAAAIADGYTVADGQVWKPNPDAENCDNEYCTPPHNKLVKAGGGGT